MALALFGCATKGPPAGPRERCGRSRSMAAAALACSRPPFGTGTAPWLARPRRHAGRRPRRRPDAAPGRAAAAHPRDSAQPGVHRRDGDHRGAGQRTLTVDGANRSYTVVVPGGGPGRRAAAAGGRLARAGRLGPAGAHVLRAGGGGEWRGRCSCIPDALPLPSFGNRTGWDLRPEGPDLRFFDAMLEEVSQDHLRGPGPCVLHRPQLRRIHVQHPRLPADPRVTGDRPGGRRCGRRRLHGRRRCRPGSPTRATTAWSRSVRARPPAICGPGPAAAQPPASPSPPLPAWPSTAAAREARSGGASTAATTPGPLSPARRSGRSSTVCDRRAARAMPRARASRDSTVHPSGASSGWPRRAWTSSTPTRPSYPAPATAVRRAARAAVRRRRPSCQPMQRQQLQAVNADEVRDAQIAALGAPAGDRQAGAAVR